MATKKINSTQPNQIKENATNAAKVAGKEPNAMEILLKVSSCNYGEEPEFPNRWMIGNNDGNNDEYWGNHFVWGATQVNLDLAQAALCEMEGDIAADNSDNGIFDFCRSPMYWKLRTEFLKDAVNESDESFLYLVWRAYNAGRLSPDRIVPRTKAERLRERLRQYLPIEEQEADGRRRLLADARGEN
jgi:hypothetical protein